MLAKVSNYASELVNHRANSSNPLTTDSPNFVSTKCLIVKVFKFTQKRSRNGQNTGIIVEIREECFLFANAIWCWKLVQLLHTFNVQTHEPLDRYDLSILKAGPLPLPSRPYRITIHQICCGDNLAKLNV